MSGEVTRRKGMRPMETEWWRCSDSENVICNLPEAEGSKGILGVIQKTFIANEIISVVKKKIRQ